MLNCEIKKKNLKGDNFIFIFGISLIVCSLEINNIEIIILKFLICKLFRILLFIIVSLDILYSWDFYIM